MKQQSRTERLVAAGLLLVCCFTAAADSPPPEDVIDFRHALDSAYVKAKRDTVVKVVESNGLHLYQVEFEKGPQYPGVIFTCPAKQWDLSAYTGVETVVTNPGTEDSIVGVRIDNAADNGKWNTGSDWVRAGATTTIKVTFGKEVNFTHHVEKYFVRPGYALDPARVVAINVFCSKPKGKGSIVIQEIRGVHSSAWEAARTPTRLKEIEDEKKDNHQAP